MTTKPKGVMIKGMDMPERCFDCPACYATMSLCRKGIWELKENICKVKNKTAAKTKRPWWCPLQEVK